jgi:hypothetical protein
MLEKGIVNPDFVESGSSRAAMEGANARYLDQQQEGAQGQAAAHQRIPVGQASGNQGLAMQTGPRALRVPCGMQADLAWHVLST